MGDIFVDLDRGDFVDRIGDLYGRLMDLDSTWGSWLRYYLADDAHDGTNLNRGDLFLLCLVFDEYLGHSRSITDEDKSHPPHETLFVQPAMDHSFLVYMILELSCKCA
jgi:hypothetical protein